MVFESYYWKHDLIRIARELESACVHKKGIATVIRDSFLQRRYDDGYLDYRLEKCIILSAFIVRLLLESNKLSVECESLSVTLDQYDASALNTKKINPINRRFDLDRLYDLSKSVKVRLNVRRMVNQVMHSAVVIAFGTDDNANITGFFVVSDYDSTNKLYYCTISEWIRMIRVVGNDEVVSLVQYFDQEKGAWAMERSNKLHSDNSISFLIGDGSESVNKQ